MKKFPNILHVTMDTQDKETFLLPSSDGVYGIAVAGQSKPCAIYKLIEVGQVIAPPKFVSKRKTRTE